LKTGYAVNVNIFSKENEFLLYLQTFLGTAIRFTTKPLFLTNHKKRKITKNGGVAQMVRA
jgi:hypothetical protein